MQADYSPETTNSYYPETITCAPASQYHKCERLPLDGYEWYDIRQQKYASIPGDGTALDDTNWTANRNGVTYHVTD